MKEWWRKLAVREKQMVAIGAVVVGLFLIYVLVWSPLSIAVVDLRSQLQRNQRLLVWMQEADKRIQFLEKKPVSRVSSSGSLLSIVQKHINRTPLVANVDQLHQVDNDSVELVFQKVDFDQLMRWLIQLANDEQVQILQIAIKPSGAPAIVEARVVLKK